LLSICSNGSIVDAKFAMERLRRATLPVENEE
jgi:hypothetical protein